MIAALFVERGGPYFDREDVDPWGEERDARTYAGPWPVVAHPPCGAWGRLKHFHRQQDSDCAPIAVTTVRKWGGVLEHPAHSSLWRYCGLPAPYAFNDNHGGYTIEVCQVDWGHVARKRTWLYLVGIPRDALAFRPHREPTHWIGGFRISPRAGGRYKDRGSPIPPGIKACSKQQRRRTPPEFADWLIALAHAARVEVAA